MRVARPRRSGRPLEPVGNGGPRGMIAQGKPVTGSLDRTRLTSLRHPEDPAAGRLRLPRRVSSTHRQRQEPARLGHCACAARGGALPGSSRSAPACVVLRRATCTPRAAARRHIGCRGSRRRVRYGTTRGRTAHRRHNAEVGDASSGPAPRTSDRCGRLGALRCGDSGRALGQPSGRSAREGRGPVSVGAGQPNGERRPVPFLRRDGYSALVATDDAPNDR